MLVACVNVDEHAKDFTVCRVQGETDRFKTDRFTGTGSPVL